MTQPDLYDALKRPGIPDAFDEVVAIFVDAAATDDTEKMVEAGYAFGHLHAMVGGGQDTRDPLLGLVRDAAAEAVRVSSGLRLRS